jgi:diguanylate cyclase (GGDEF)-like protein/PAS domain S-box-containing protein
VRSARVGATPRRSAARPPRAVAEPVRDDADWRLLEQRLARQRELFDIVRDLTTAVSEATTTAAAIEATLRRICQHTGFALGHAYLTDAGGATLLPTSIWHQAGAGADYSRFRRASETTVVAAGEGLAGRALETGEAAWLTDLPDHPELLQGARGEAPGLRSALAQPVLLDGQVVGVLEFFSPEVVPPDDAVLEVMGTLGAQVGRAVERQRAAERLSASEERLRTIIDTATDAFVGIDAASLVTDWNLESERIFGWTREEAVGRLLSDLIIPEQYRSAHLAGLRRYLDTGEAHVLNRTIEIVAQHRSGREFPVELRIWPAQDEAGRHSFSAFIRDISARRVAEERLTDTNDRLLEAVADLEARNREIKLISEMGDFLQSCVVVEEAYQAIGQFSEQIFADVDGSLCVYKNSKDLLEVVARWGVPGGQSVFDKNDCWALRRGRTHVMELGQAGLGCLHAGPMPSWSICVPMLAQGETLGILHVHGRPPDGDDREPTLAAQRQQLAVTVAEQLALAIANFRLRETLRLQSVRDPLTGLYNRRYLEESLERELRRSERAGNPMSLIMLDIDHFKDYNDRFGHEAGDRVLSLLGDFLKAHLRGSDIACRYGGEEFILLLPDAPLGVTVQRASTLREEVKKIPVKYGGATLEGITLSLGVATLRPSQSGAQLIRAADVALYEAKAKGRDQVAIAAGDVP